MMLRNIYRWLIPFLGAVACTLAVLLGAYSLPVADRQDVGSEPVTLQGLYKPETNERFSYAYSSGYSSLHMPQVGTGNFLLSMRLAGPAEEHPVRSYLTASGYQADLGHVSQLRTYHLLVPASTQGDFTVAVQSTTVQISGDQRQLGLLIDWVDIQSTGLHVPATPILLSIPIILLLCCLAASISSLSLRRKTLSFLIVTAAISASFALTRGREAIHPLWLAGTTLLLVALILNRLRTSTRSPAFVVTMIFIVWRIALWVIGAVGLWYSRVFYQVADDITSGGSITGRKQFLWTAFVDGWAHYDSGHYQSIALSGYRFFGEQWPNIAFFPLYPLLTRLLLPLTENIVIAQLVVSHIALYVALLLLYNLVAQDLDREVAYWSIIMLLAFPTSVFFIAGYTESLALALAVGAVWALRRQRWWLAGIAGCFLALTRLPGVLVSPLILFAYFQHQGWKWRQLQVKQLLSVLLPLLGLGIFMLYQWWLFATPTAFLSAQNAWDQHLSPPWTMPVMWLEWFRTSTERPMMILQAAIWLSFIGLTYLCFVRLPPIYGLTMLLFLLPAYLSNRSQSLPRYVLLAFPTFIVMALLTRSAGMRRLLLITMVPLLVLAVLLFTNGFWLA